MDALQKQRGSNKKINKYLRNCSYICPGKIYAALNSDKWKDLNTLVN